MKVLFLKDVPTLGQKGDIREVKNGYGRNFLIPKGFARIANEQDMRESTIIKSHKQAELKQKQKDMEEYASRLGGVSLQCTRKANEKGHLFAAVTAHDIVQLLSKKGFSDIDEKHISGPPIKTIGEHEIAVQAGEQNITIKIEIKNHE